VARSGAHRRTLAGAVALGLALGLALYPAHYDGRFIRDYTPAVTTYLREQPKNVLVAGVPLDTDAAAAFAGRAVLTDREHRFALHLG